jgi:hypothetical protein
MKPPHRRIVKRKRTLNYAKRLAKSLSETQTDARHKRGGKNPTRAESRRHARRALADARDVSPLTRLIQSLGEEGIRFQMVGMSAAIIQGVPATTLDTDLWVDLPERQYVRLLNLVVKQGGTALARTVYALADGSLVNFIFGMTGLGAFAEEYAQAREILWNGLRIRVLPLGRIYASKQAAGRQKDLAHLPLLRRVLRGHRRAGTSASGRKQSPRR